MTGEVGQWREELRKSLIRQVKTVLWGMVKTIEAERRELGRRTVQKRE